MNMGGTPPSQPLRGLLRTYFRWLYHGLAWSYDAVAWTVSIGRWFRWIDAIVPLLQGPRILELGHGTGYLIRQLTVRTGIRPIGIDESRQMGRLALKRASGAMARPALVRAVAQQMPLASSSFDSITATFPTEYIFETATIAELKRVLRPGGRLVVLPAAWIVGQRLTERLAAWLFRLTRQVPPSPERWVDEKLAQPLAANDFKVEVRSIELNASILLVVVATR